MPQFYVGAIYFLIMHLSELIAILIKIIVNTLKCFDLMNDKQMIWKILILLSSSCHYFYHLPLLTKNFNFKSAFLKLKINSETRMLVKAYYPSAMLLVHIY